MLTSPWKLIKNGSWYEFKMFNIEKCRLCDKYFNSCEYDDTINYHYYFIQRCSTLMKYENDNLGKQLFVLVKLLFSSYLFIH